jgi:hypothetical protein
MKPAIGECAPPKIAGLKLSFYIKKQTKICVLEKFRVKSGL